MGIYGIIWEMTRLSLIAGGVMACFYATVFAADAVHYQFNFNSSPVAGTTQIAPGTSFSSQAGYGFEARRVAPATALATTTATTSSTTAPAIQKITSTKPTAFPPLFSV